MPTELDGNDTHRCAGGFDLCRSYSCNDTSYAEVYGVVVRAERGEHILVVIAVVDCLLVSLDDFFCVIGEHHA